MADWENIKTETTNFREQFLEQHKDKTGYQNSKEFKKHIMSTMGKHIPSKSTCIRHNLLWMNISLKRVISEKQRLGDKT